MDNAQTHGRRRKAVIATVAALLSLGVATAVMAQDTSSVSRQTTVADDPSEVVTAANDATSVNGSDVAGLTEAVPTDTGSPSTVQSQSPPATDVPDVAQLLEAAEAAESESTALAEEVRARVASIVDSLLPSDDAP